MKVAAANTSLPLILLNQLKVRSPASLNSRGCLISALPFLGSGLVGLETLHRNLSFSMSG